TVRVAAHKLRRRLEEFYGGAEGPRLVLPRGEYRLGLAEAGAVPEAARRGWWAGLLPQTARERVAAALVPVLLAATAVATTLALRVPGVDPALRSLRQSALWAPLLDDDVPLQLVLGDYYIFGERNERGDVRR